MGAQPEFGGVGLRVTNPLDFFKHCSRSAPYKFNMGGSRVCNELNPVLHTLHLHTRPLNLCRALSYARVFFLLQSPMESHLISRRVIGARALVRPQIHDRLTWQPRTLRNIFN